VVVVEIARPIGIVPVTTTGTALTRAAIKAASRASRRAAPFAEVVGAEDLEHRSDVVGRPAVPRDEAVAIFRVGEVRAAVARQRQLGTFGSRLVA
jgi:hypothetical protein